MNRWIVTEREKAFLLLEIQDSRPTRLFIQSKERSISPEDVFIGKVQHVSRNIDAAFVDLGQEQTGYLPLKAGETLREGEDVLVQVDREAVKTKLPALTRSLTLGGDLLVLITNKKGLSFSRKWKDLNLKRSLRELLAPYCGEVGYIVRTNAAYADPEDVLEEARQLKIRCDALLERSRTRKAPALLEGAPQLFETLLRGINRSQEWEIVTDSEAFRTLFMEEFGGEQGEAQAAELSGAAGTVPAPLRFYEDASLPLEKLYRLDTLLKDVKDKRVWLRSGAYIIIEQLETMTVIDVNTGRCEQGKNLEETALRVNCEAAREIAAQLVLRNISGMIVVDFINLEEARDTEQVLEALEEAVKADPVRTEVLDVTVLGLVEMTRRGIYRPLSEQLALLG